MDRGTGTAKGGAGGWNREKRKWGLSLPLDLGGLYIPVRKSLRLTTRQRWLFTLWLRAVVRRIAPVRVHGLQSALEYEIFRNLHCK